MSTRQLATRLGRTQASVSQLERSEIEDGIRLKSLRQAADALGCDLVYALVPRTTLEQTVRDRARRLATSEVTSIHRTMQLEDQGLAQSELDERIDDYAAQLLARGALWNERSYEP